MTFLSYPKKISITNLTKEMDLSKKQKERAKKEKLEQKIKDSKKKVQASLQGDFVRVSSRDRDTLQQVIAMLRESDFGIDVQFTNYRTI